MRQLRMAPGNDREHGQPGLFDPGQWAIEDRDGETIFTGRLLGVGTSQRQQHNHGGSNTAGEFSQDARQITQRCAACRWSEIYVFEVLTRANVNQLGRYVVYTLGPSTLPGEHTRAKISSASSAYEVVELATVRHGQRNAPFLPAAHARALAMAASHDQDLADAYVNRAVA